MIELVVAPERVNANLKFKLFKHNPAKQIKVSNE